MQRCRCICGVSGGAWTIPRRSCQTRGRNQLLSSPVRAEQRCPARGTLHRALLRICYTYTHTISPMGAMICAGMVCSYCLRWLLNVDVPDSFVMVFAYCSVIALLMRYCDPASTFKDTVGKLKPFRSIAGYSTAGCVLTLRMRYVWWCTGGLVTGGTGAAGPGHHDGVRAGIPLTIAPPAVRCYVAHTIPVSRTQHGCFNASNSFEIQMQNKMKVFGGSLSE